jgi:hypothetical protein
MDQRIAQWEALYDRMYSLLVDIYGDDDDVGISEDHFWVVDDDYGGYEQKVELPSNERKQEVVNGLQAILKDGFQKWTVVVVSREGISPEAVDDPEGVRVSWNSVTR